VKKSCWSTKELEEFYYLRDLTLGDWEKFNEYDTIAFPNEPMRKESYKAGLSSINAMSIVAVHKETKEFIGFYKIGVYGKEGHVTRISVHPDHRRKGLGAKLLERSAHYLKKAGCESYFLYVQEDNEPAINLYKKYGFETVTRSYQFNVPFKMLPKEPKGRCRHVEYGEVQLTSLRFRVNPIRIQQFFGRENQHVLIYEVMGQQIGFCRFSPSFPGAMPFIIKDVKYAMDFIAHLTTYITNKKFKKVKITFDNQEALYQKLTAEKVPLNYNLLKMIKEAES